MAVRCGEGMVINPGSTGQPRDWNPMASYAIVDTQTLEVKFHRVPYDVAKLQDRLARRGWDLNAISILCRAKDDQNVGVGNIGMSPDKS
jgi:hypothetical protein